MHWKLYFSISGLYKKKLQKCYMTLLKDPATRDRTEVFLFFLDLSSLFFFLINLFTLEDNYFTVLWWFSPYIDMNQPRVHLCPPHHESPSHLPAHPIPQGCPRALALSALLHAPNLHRSSILHMLIYVFQCYSLKSSHLCLLPHSMFFTSVSLLLSCI